MLQRNGIDARATPRVEPAAEFDTTDNSMFLSLSLPLDSMNAYRRDAPYASDLAVVVRFELFEEVSWDQGVYDVELAIDKQIES